MGSKKKGKSSGGKGSLKEQLKNLDLELPQKNDLLAKASRQETKQPPGKPGVTPASPPPDEVPSDVPLSPEELFRQAVENLEPGEIYQGKYQGKAGAPLPEQPADRLARRRGPTGSQEAQRGAPERDPGDDEAAREQVLKRREEAYFEAMMGPVERLEDREKYKVAHGPNRKVYTEEEPEEEEVLARGLITPALPREGEGLHNIERLSLSQRSLFKRYERFAISEKVPQLNVRGDGREEALRLLELFIHQHSKEGTEYVEVIHGRGLQSEDEPVLKPAVLEWLEELGVRYIRGYTPRRTSSGDYGSLIIEMKAGGRRSSGRKDGGRKK